MLVLCVGDTMQILTVLLVSAANISMTMRDHLLRICAWKEISPTYDTSLKSHLKALVTKGNSQTTTRAIIFVAHSLGGIVVKSVRLTSYDSLTCC
jgi:hypothetical protein